MDELSQSDCKDLIDICNLSFSALDLDDVKFVIDSDGDEREQSRSVFLLPDTLLPVIVITANALANNLFENKFSNEVVFSFDVIKDEFETLCFSRIVKSDKKEMDYIKKCLITAEVISQTFVPDSNRKINLTPVIKSWREFLNTQRDGRIISHKTIYNDLIDYNLGGLKNKNKLKNIL